MEERGSNRLDHLFYAAGQGDEATKRFVEEHRMEDVRGLALQASRFPEVNMRFALDQIAGWQTARKKIPTWAEAAGVVFPPHLSMEQCSSELTARYKGEILELSKRGRYVDLTGGFGVDFFFMSQGYEDRIYVERNPELCAISQHNFEVLGEDVTVVNGEAQEYVRAMEPADVVFLDPARRDERGGRTYGIADCTPNVLEFLDELLEKAEYIVLKLSPMLDWRKAMEDLEGTKEWGSSSTERRVVAVHIVSVQNECKELVVVVGKSKGATTQRKGVCVNLLPDGKRERFEFNISRMGTSADRCVRPEIKPEDLNGWYLYEPNASVMKAGCFDELSVRYDVYGLAQNSHLFVSEELRNEFPGRQFEVMTATTLNKKELRRTLAGVNCANITVRNFPMSVAELRKRLRLKEGGDVYLFATTLQTDQHVLIIAKKVT